jgi:hypothetical protein
MWQLYLPASIIHMSSHGVIPSVLDNPPEAFGIPSIDVVTSMLTPIGLRCASALDVLQNEEDVDHYCHYLIDRIMALP